LRTQFLIEISEQATLSPLKKEATGGHIEEEEEVRLDLGKMCTIFRNMLNASRPILVARASDEYEDKKRWENICKCVIQIIIIILYFFPSNHLSESERNVSVHGRSNTVCARGCLQARR
jgi:hypothetical protein